MIAAVAAVNRRTIVIANAGGPVLMPWLADVPAVVLSWYAGQQGGAALARVLAGDVDPGGRLPVTFGVRESDYPARSPRQYSGVDFAKRYSEGAFIGYRHFDVHRIEPLFCFGHGLSYTELRYDHLHVDRPAAQGVRVRVTVRNIGNRTGTRSCSSI